MQKEQKKLKEHIRHIMLFYFRKGVNATRAAEKICNVYGAFTITGRTVQIWYARFRKDESKLEDRPSGRRSANSSMILTIANKYPYLTLQEIADVVGVSYSTVHKHLKTERYINCVDVSSYVTTHN